METANALIDIIKTRRSVRRYAPGPVPREVLETIVDCGRLAPTSNNLQTWEFVVVTDRDALRRIGEIATHCPVVFPVHPRTRAQLAQHGLPPSIHAVAPYGYIDFLGLLSSASLALTDSGGIQEETSVLGVPCLTLRHNTERPVTVEIGTNRVVGTDPETIVAAAVDALSRSWSPAEIPLWDGKAGERIADVLVADLS